jgi:hypothetical protein
MALQPIRIKAFPVEGQIFTYEGYIASSVTGRPIVGGLTGVTAQASMDGGAYSSTGVTLVEQGVSGFFDLTLTAAIMTGVTQGIVRVTVTNTDAETWYLDLRTDGRRERAYGIPINVQDAENGDYCEETGLLVPASRLKTVDGNRVADFWDGGIED